VTARDIMHCQTIDKLLDETSEHIINLADSSDIDTGVQPETGVLDADVISLLDDSLAMNNRIVMSAPVAKEYPLSAMQQLQISFETPGSLAIEPLQRAMNLLALRRAYGNLIAQHGLLRSMPVESGGRHVWREYGYDGEETPLIPVINVAEHLGDEHSVQALIEKLTTRIFKGEGILHQLVVAVVDQSKYFLVWIVSHVIFDRVSKEILSRHLIRHYDAVLQGQVLPAEARSFQDYVRQLARGPQGVETRDIVQVFRLHEFYEAKQKAKRLVEATGSRSSTNFNIVVPLKSSWQIEHPWETALVVHVKGLRQYLQMDELPILFVTEGREFENQRYYDTVGELTDMIPLFVDARLSPTEITQSVLDRLEFVKQHNIGFLHLAAEGATYARWSEITRLMDIGSDFEHLDILMFNILGYADDLTAESIVEASWVQPQPLPIQTLLNAITGVHSDKLVSSFRTSCAVNIDRIRDCFKHAATELA
jgi:surfactin family lipopeptide synthetase A